MNRSPDEGRPGEPEPCKGELDIDSTFIVKAELKISMPHLLVTVNESILIGLE